MKNIMYKWGGGKFLVEVIFILFLCIQVFQLYSKNTDPKQITNVLTPIIQVKPTYLDFKYAKITKSKSLKICIYNKGDSVLTVNSMKVIKSDSSQYFDFLIDSTLQFPITITQGDSKKIVISFFPKNVYTHRGILQIFCNAPTVPIVRLTGYCVPLNEPQLEVKVQELNFGQVPTTTPKTEAFKVYNVGYTRVDITPKLASQNTPFEIEFSPNSINAGDSNFVKIRFAPDKEFTYTNSLIISHNSYWNRDINIKLSGSGIFKDQPRIKIEPTSLDFGQVAVGKPKENSFKIKNTGTALLTIYSLSPPQNSAFTIISPSGSSFSLDQGDDIDVIVQFKPLIKGDFKTTLPISSNDPLNSTIEYPLSGKGILLPIIDVEPDTLRFGIVNIGSNKKREILVYSRGSTPLIIDSIKITKDDKIFSPSYPELPFTLEKDDPIKIAVTFAPTQRSIYNDSLIIYNNDRTIKIPLIGEGISSDGKLISSLINYPNPFHFGENTTIEFTLSQDTQAIVNIYDLSGQLVAKFKVEKTSVIQWDGLDYNNSRVAYGVYLCELIATAPGKEERRYRKIAITPK